MWTWGRGHSVPCAVAGVVQPCVAHIFASGSSLGHPLIRDLPAASAQYMEAPPRPRSPVPTAVTSAFMWWRSCCLFQEASFACPGGLAALSRQHSLSENGLPRWGQSGQSSSPWSCPGAMPSPQSPRLAGPTFRLAAVLGPRAKFPGPPSSALSIRSGW